MSSRRRQASASITDYLYHKRRSNVSVLSAACVALRRTCSSTVAWMRHGSTGCQCFLSIKTSLVMLTFWWTNLHVDIQEDYSSSIPFVLTETIDYNWITSYKILLIALTMTNGHARVQRAPPCKFLGPPLYCINKLVVKWIIWYYSLFDFTWALEY